MAFLLDNGLSTNCFLILLILGRGKSNRKMKILAAPDCDECSVFLCMVNIKPLLQGYFLISRTNPHLYGLSTFRLIYLKLGYFLLVLFLCLLKLSSQNKRMMHRLKIRIDFNSFTEQYSANLNIFNIFVILIPFSKIIIKRLF